MTESLNSRRIDSFGSRSRRNRKLSRTSSSGVRPLPHRSSSPAETSTVWCVADPWSTTSTAHRYPVPSAVQRTSTGTALNFSHGSEIWRLRPPRLAHGPGENQGSHREVRGHDAGRPVGRQGPLGLDLGLRPLSYDPGTHTGSHLRALGDTCDPGAAPQAGGGAHGG